jgi:hypothetical protein
MARQSGGCVMAGCVGERALNPFIQCRIPLQYNTQRKFVRGRRQGEEKAILAHQFAGELVLDAPGRFANLNLTSSAMSRAAF